MSCFGIDIYPHESVYPTGLRLFWQKLEIDGREYMQLASVELTDWGTITRLEHVHLCIPVRRFAALVGHGIATATSENLWTPGGTEDEAEVEP